MDLNQWFKSHWLKSSNPEGYLACKTSCFNNSRYKLQSQWS